MAQWLTFPGTTGHYAGTPSTSALDVTNDLEIVVSLRGDLRRSNQERTFIGRRQSASTANLIYRFYMTNLDVLTLEWTTAADVDSSAAATTTTPDTGDIHWWLRATLDVDNGAGAYEVKFYYSNDAASTAVGSVSWTQLGTTVTGGSTTNIIDGRTSTMEVHSYNAGAATYQLASRYYQAIVYDGIGGTEIAHFDAEDFVVGDTDTDTAVDSTGKTWTLNGASTFAETEGIMHIANAVASTTVTTTSFDMVVPSTTQAGDLMTTLFVSRGHAATTDQPTVTGGGVTWTSAGNNTDRQAQLWYAFATSTSEGDTISVAGCVNSCTGGMDVWRNVDSTTPITNLAFEDNTSGNETHAGITPSNDKSYVCFGVLNPTNDTISVSSMSAATAGILEPEWWLSLFSGGDDCYVIFTGIAQLGAAAATGDITWSQSNSVTRSVVFALKLATSSAGTVTPDAIARSFTVDSATAKGAGKSTVAATARSFTVDAPVARGSAKSQPGAIALAASVLAATPDGGATPATVTPDAITWAAALNQVALVGGAVVQVSPTTVAVVLPQALPKIPGAVSPAATATSVTLPVVSVQGKTLVQTGMSVSFALNSPTIKAGAVIVVGAIDLAAVASQVTIITDDTDWAEQLFIDPVW